MSLSNPQCPHRYCEFCDTEEDIYRMYEAVVTTREVLENEGRIPGFIDESN